MMPYENATSGKRAIEEIQKTLRTFGAASVGVMENYAEGEVLVQFEHQGKRVSLRASAKGYAGRWLKAHPYSYRQRGSKIDHERRALEIGNVAVYSILRDWIKGQITAIECGLMDFEAAFLGQILMNDGRTVHQTITENNWLKIEDRTGDQKTG